MSQGSTRELKTMIFSTTSHKHYKAIMIYHNCYKKEKRKKFLVVFFCGHEKLCAYNIHLSFFNAWSYYDLESIKEKQSELRLATVDEGNEKNFGKGKQ